jgi:rhomboid protease GluP
MKSFPLKLRRIFWPFSLIAVGFILLYSFLNALLTIDNAAIPLKEEVTDLWVPLLLPFIPLLIWLRPRIKLLNLKTKRSNNLPFLYLMIAAFAIGVPAIILQGYLRTSLGKLTPLSSISQIREKKPTKYYSVSQYYIDTSFAAFQNTAEVSGKYNDRLNYTIYIVCPVFDQRLKVAPPVEGDVKIGPAPAPVKGLLDSLRDTRQDEKAGGSVSPTLPQAWVCLNYKKQISNRLSRSEKHEQWDEFVINTLQDWHGRDPNKFSYLERIGNTEERDNYQKAILKNTFFTTIPGPLFILEPRSTAFSARNGNKLGWVFGAFGIGCLVWLIMLVIPKMDGGH